MQELVYGIHSVRVILDNNPEWILKIYVIGSFLDIRWRSLFYQIKKYNISYVVCKRDKLDSKVQGASHQGIIAEVRYKNYIKESDLLYFLRKSKTIPLLLILDGITDPRNLGACLRTADSAGVTLVISPRDRSASLNETVRKVASGAVGYVPFLQVTNLARILKLLHQYNIWIIGTVIRSNRLLFDSQLARPLAFVVGSESNGIRHLTKKNCDELVSIPMLGSVVSSLNVSVAAGICLFEAVRQRRR